MRIKPAVVEMIPPTSVNKGLGKLSSKGSVRSMTPGIAVIIEMQRPWFRVFGRGGIEGGGCGRGDPVR